LLVKSKYWATLPTTQGASVKNPANNWGETLFKCSNDDEIQVFNIDQNHVNSNPLWNYRFNGCKNKSILINVQGTGNINMKGVDMYDSDGKFGFLDGGFDTCMIASILWNFPDAANVEIAGSTEFMGSILVTGNLKFKTSGHSGRTMVLGNLEHSYGGSEFHNYPFDPPKPLPDPDCDEFAPRDSPTGQRTVSPAMNPTNKPSGSPVENPTASPSAGEGQQAPSDECTAIPQDRLPQNKGGTTDTNCSKCHPSINQSWYPCNEKNPPICEGNCVLH